MLLLGLLATTTIGVQAQNVIKVTVGKNGTLLFKPRSMHAEAGDFILFDFYNVRLLFPFSIILPTWLALPPFDSSHVSQGVADTKVARGF